MALIAPSLLVIIATFHIVHAYWGADLPPGPYCGKQNICCRSRKDDCSHEILGTLCYCDEFCDRPNGRDDCCPDYLKVCKGRNDAPGEIKAPCKHGAAIYLPGEKRMDNCNNCVCVENGTELSWECDHDTCVVDEHLVRRVNTEERSWKAVSHPQFYGKKLKDALVYKLGTLPLSNGVTNMTPIKYNKNIEYPREFDARKQWPGYISPIRDQGWCGSDWAVSVAGVASDRFAIQSNGAVNLVLSPQSLLSCNTHQQGCKGGNIDRAWHYARSHGLVEEKCFPYTATKSSCPFHSKSVEEFCRLPNKENALFIGPPSRLKKEQDIMYDIMQSGPLQAVMTVYQDFFHYKHGVYRRTQFGYTDLQGLHSVRIVGWGEDRGDKFWIVANSWGREWGENGFFRIARGNNESDIESFVVTVLVDVKAANKK